MKKISSQLLIAALAFTTVLTSCGAGETNKKAEATATNFYNDLKKKDFDAALNLCSDRAFNDDKKETWKKYMERNSGLLGEMKTFTKTSDFNISTSTSNGTTVSLTFDVQWEFGKSSDSLVLLKDKDGSMKVLRYAWEHKDAKYMSQLSASEKEAGQYMEAVKEGNYDAAIHFCSEDALKATPKETWAATLNAAVTQLGSISKYSIIKDSSNYNIGSTGDLGKGNYYQVVVQSDRGGNKVMEKIVFFQKNYGEPVKLTGHYFL